MHHQRAKGSGTGLRTTPGRRPLELRLDMEPQHLGAERPSPIDRRNRPTRARFSRRECETHFPSITLGRTCGHVQEGGRHGKKRINLNRPHGRGVCWRTTSAGRWTGCSKIIRPPASIALPAFHARADPARMQPRHHSSVAEKSPIGPAIRCSHCGGSECGASTVDPARSLEYMIAYPDRPTWQSEWRATPTPR